MEYKLDTFENETGYGYNLLKDGIPILSGDSFKSKEDLIIDLSELSEALRSIFG